MTEPEPPPTENDDIKTPFSFKLMIALTVHLPGLAA